MVNTNELKAAIVRRGLTQGDVAKMLNITPTTFSNKMKKRQFGTDEAKTMIDKLSITDPISIFFAD